MQPLVAAQSGSVVLLGLIAHLLDRQVLRLRLRSEFAKYDRLRRGFDIDSNHSHSESIPQSQVDNELNAHVTSLRRVLPSTDRQYQLDNPPYARLLVLSYETEFRCYIPAAVFHK